MDGLLLRFTRHGLPKRDARNWIGNEEKTAGNTTPQPVERHAPVKCQITVGLKNKVYAQAIGPAGHKIEAGITLPVQAGYKAVIGIGSGDEPIFRKRPTMIGSIVTPELVLVGQRKVNLPLGAYGLILWVSHAPSNYASV